MFISVRLQEQRLKEEAERRRELEARNQRLEEELKRMQEEQNRILEEEAKRKMEEKKLAVSFFQYLRAEFVIQFTQHFHFCNESYISAENILYF